MENKKFLTTEELGNLISQLRLEIVEKEQIISEKDRAILEKTNLLVKALEENERLRHQLNQLLQDKFGTKSEKSKNLNENAFDEVQEPDNTSEIEEVEKEILLLSDQPKRGGKPGRRPLPGHLPRIQKFYDLTEAQKICHCGFQLIRIGEEVSEQLDIIPAKIQVIQHIKYKYACKGCEERVKTVPSPAAPIPKSIAAPGVNCHQYSSIPLPG